MNKIIKVTKADRSKCLEILSEPRLYRILPIEEGSDLRSYLTGVTYKYMLATVCDHSLLFYVESLGAGIYDIHIACPRKSIVASRALSLVAIAWALQTHKLSLRALTTNCPEGKIANMCRKIGAVEIKSISNQVYFMITPDQFKYNLK